MSSSDQSYLCQIMLDLVHEAGKVALGLIDESSPDLKADASVITIADRSISALAHRVLDPLLATGEHFLVDEEDPLRGSMLHKGKLEHIPYLWAIDPIDATRAYANRMPHYGISLGLVKNGRPWMGAVLFPSLDELFYCDGKNAYFVRHPFTDKAIARPVVGSRQDISSVSVFICTDELLKEFVWDSPDCRVMIFSAAVCEFCWPAIGRGCGSLSRVYLWDMAGSWPIFEKAGLKMFSFRTGRPLDQLSVELFETGESPWRFRDFYILCRPEHFELLRARVRLQNKAAAPREEEL